MNDYRWSYILWFQMLAMNRGEHQGVLSMKIVIPDNTYVHFFNFCQQKWLGLAPPHYYRTQLVMMSTEDSWERLGEYQIGYVGIIEELLGILEVQQTFIDLLPKIIA